MCGTQARLITMKVDHSDVKIIILCSGAIIMAIHSSYMYEFHYLVCIRAPPDSPGVQEAVHDVRG